MWLLRTVLFRWFWNRMSGRGRQPQRYYGRGRGAPMYGRRQRGRGGFFGPFPYYSTRTRGGSRVAVSGCCLPLALTMAAVPALGVRTLLKRL
jgi:hypothetical protein